MESEKIQIYLDKAALCKIFIVARKKEKFNKRKNVSIPAFIRDFIEDATIRDMTEKEKELLVSKIWHKIEENKTKRFKPAKYESRSRCVPSVLVAKLRELQEKDKDLATELRREIKMQCHNRALKDREIDIWLNQIEDQIKNL